VAVGYTIAASQPGSPARMWRRGVSARRVRRTLRNKPNPPPRPDAAGHGHGGSTSTAPCPALPCPAQKKKKNHVRRLAGDRVGGRRAAARNTDRVSACVSSAPRLSDLAASGARLSRPRGWGALASYLAGRSCSCIDRLRVVLAHRVGRRAEIKSPAGGRYGHQTVHQCIDTGQPR